MPGFDHPEVRAVPFADELPHDGMWSRPPGAESLMCAEREMPIAEH